MVALSVLLPFTMALSFDTVYIFGFDLSLFTFRLIGLQEGLFTAFSTFDMDQLGKIRVNTTGKSALILHLLLFIKRKYAFI